MLRDVQHLKLQNLSAWIVRTHFNTRSALFGLILSSLSQKKKKKLWKKESRLTRESYSHSSASGQGGSSLFHHPGWTPPPLYLCSPTAKHHWHSGHGGFHCTDDWESKHQKESLSGTWVLTKINLEGLFKKTNRCDEEFLTEACTNSCTTY